MPSRDLSSPTRLNYSEYTTWSLTLQLTSNLSLRAELSVGCPTRRRGITSQLAIPHRSHEASFLTSPKYSEVTTRPLILFNHLIFLLSNLSWEPT